MSRRILAASGWVALALTLVLLFYAVLAVEVLETRYLVAPLSSGYLTLNSSSFSALTTGEYLAVTIQMIPVWAEIQVRVFPPVSLNQTQNPAFSYFGLFRDAEAYYALYLSGYRTVFSICTQINSGTTTSSLISFSAVSQRRCAR